MSKKLTTLAILPALMLLQSCQTPTTAVSAPQSAASPVQAIPCPSEPPIDYAAPRDPKDAAAWLAGNFPDPTNRYDTPVTVDQIRKHNAAVASVCQKP